MGSEAWEAWEKKHFGLNTIEDFEPTKLKTLREQQAGPKTTPEEEKLVSGSWRENPLVAALELPKDFKRPAVGLQIGNFSRTKGMIDAMPLKTRRTMVPTSGSTAATTADYTKAPSVLATFCT